MDFKSGEKEGNNKGRNIKINKTNKTEDKTEKDMT